MRVELLYFEGCPSFLEAEALLCDTLAREGIETEVVRIEVTTQTRAEELGFVGSPTIRIDGRDVDEAGAERALPSLSCRVYATETGRLQRFPTHDQLERAVARAKRSA